MRAVVAVLRGGPSSEYEISLQSGAAVLEALDREKFEPLDVFIDRGGQWHLHGMPVMPERALRGVDVAFNVIHGQYGEDGRLHRVLDALAVPYTGSDAFSSTLVFNKDRTRRAVAKLGIKVAHGVVVDSDKISDMEKTALNLFRSLPHPAVVKPLAAGSSVGVTIAENFHTLAWGLEQAFKIGPKALVEEYIPGREATVGVINDFRNENIYVLPPVEIILPPKHKFFSYDAKYSGETIERVPGNFGQDEKRGLMDIAKTVHDALGLSHYSRSDFIVSNRGIYFLEVNNAAAIGMTKESLFPKALSAVGSKLSEFLDHIVGLARRKK